jgi:hypothetical protein
MHKFINRLYSLYIIDYNKYFITFIYNFIIFLIVTYMNLSILNKDFVNIKNYIFIYVD